MPESYETPGSSLGKITRWWQGAKAAGQTPQPWEVTDAYLDQMGVLGEHQKGSFAAANAARRRREIESANTATYDRSPSPWTAQPQETWTPQTQPQEPSVPGGSSQPAVSPGGSLPWDPATGQIVSPGGSLPASYAEYVQGLPPHITPLTEDQWNANRSGPIDTGGE